MRAKLQDRFIHNMGDPGITKPEVFPYAITDPGFGSDLVFIVGEAEMKDYTEYLFQV